MSMSMSVEAFRPPDARWNRMKEVYDSCIAAGVPIPEQVDDFFENQPPDDAGIQIYLSGCPDPHPSCTKYQGEGREGYEIDLAQLPENITKVRFYCSW